MMCSVCAGFPAVLRVGVDALQLGDHLLPRLPLLPPLHIRGLPPHEGQVGEPAQLEDKIYGSII